MDEESPLKSHSAQTQYLRRGMIMLRPVAHSFHFLRFDKSSCVLKHYDRLLQSTAENRHDMCHL